MDCSNAVSIECLCKRFKELLGIQHEEKFRQKYYPPTVKRVRCRKRLTPRPIRGKRPTASRHSKPDDDSEGDPSPSPKMIFLNSPVIFVQEAERGKVSARTAKVNTLSDEDLDPRCRTSYLKMISGLCKMRREINPAGREAVGIIERQLSQDGLGLNAGTIRKILNEVEEIRKVKKTQ